MQFEVPQLSRCFAPIVLLLGTISAAPTLLPLPVEIVANIGLGVWIENIAVRVGGEILAVGLTPNLFQANPRGNSTPVIVHTFPAPITALAGLTETTPDLFYVTAGNISNTTVQPVAGTLSVWEVNMAGFTPTTGLRFPVRKVADFPKAGLLDGMTTLNAKKGLVLMSDPFLGVVWSLNVITGAISEIINIPLMKSVPGKIPMLGINGIKYVRGSLYFTNTNQQVFARLPLHANGTAAGNPAVLNSMFGQPDDFTLHCSNNAFVAVNADSLAMLQPNGNTTVLAGGTTSTALLGITGAKFGRTLLDFKTLYMGTTGGSHVYATTRDFTNPGGILKINLEGTGYL